MNEIAVYLFAENSAGSSLSEWLLSVYKPRMVSWSTIERLRSQLWTIELLNGCPAPIATIEPLEQLKRLEHLKLPRY